MTTPTDTPFKLGYQAGRDRAARWRCPYPKDTAERARWREAYSLGLKVRASSAGSGKVNATSGCAFPTDCRATGAGLCRSCTMMRKHADPEFAARRDAKINAARDAALADPAIRARIGSAARDRLAKKRAADPSFGKKVGAKIKAHRRAHPEIEAKRVESLKAYWASPAGLARKDSQRAIIAAVNRSGSKAHDKMVKTRVASGEWLSRSDKRKIVAEVRDTQDPIEVIAGRWGKSDTRIREIARAAGVSRGKGWRPKKDGSP